MKKAILTKINKENISKYGGRYIRTFWKDINTNDTYLFDCYLDHAFSKRFFPYLKKQTILDNLTIKTNNNRKYICGYSNFIYCGIKKHTENE
jgi:hypothetical protein|tara:strand:+ start:355 stop:630 length:276 start_codon:yes stop_codon:yes gene_type:complete